MNKHFRNIKMSNKDYYLQLEKSNKIPEYHWYFIQACRYVDILLNRQILKYKNEKIKPNGERLEIYIYNKALAYHNKIYNFKNNSFGESLDSIICEYIRTRVCLYTYNLDMGTLERYL